MPSRLKSAPRMTSAAPPSGMVTGLAKRPPPSPATRSSVFEPGLLVTRSVGPPVVNEPAATAAVASVLVTTGEPELVSIADMPVPAR